MRNILIGWIAAWPTISTLLFFLDEIIAGWPLLLRTFVLSGLMVASMPYVIFTLEKVSAKLRNTVFP